MRRESKRLLARIGVTAVLLIAAYCVDRATDWPLWAGLLLYLPAYFLIGWDVFREAGEGLAHGEFLDEHFLMCLATLGALGIGFLPDGEPQFPEAVFVLLFFQVGELFEQIAEGRSRRSIAALMQLRPDSATVERDGVLLSVAPETVAVGEVISVRPGERIPLDGAVVEGASALDTVALTGESMPRSVAVGDAAYSGCVNLSGVLRIRVTRPFGESTASKILELVENAQNHKSKSERFITRFARYYTPSVVAAALLLAFLPPLLSGNFAASIAVWLGRALTFLVVSCPCALVISVPLTFFGGIGGASRSGILIKGSDCMEALAKTGTVVFDKTGTLTRGVFAVTAIHPQLVDERTLLHLAAHVERYSTHPIALSLRQAYGNEADGCEVVEVVETAGQGIQACINGQTVCVGNEKFMESLGIVWRPCHHAGTIVHVVIDGVYAGHVVISDQIKADAAETVRGLQKLGVSRTVMLTGDREEVAQAVARELGLSEYHAGLLPADKVAQVEALLAQKRPGTALCFVGDGINDAPVLARADVGVAMGALGSDAAIEAADVVLMDDKPSGVVRAVRIARRTRSIARQNIVFALAVKLAVLVLAAVGLAPMGLAVFADVGVTVLAVCNAMRTLRRGRSDKM